MEEGPRVTRSLGKNRACRDPGSVMSHKWQLPWEAHLEFYLQVERRLMSVAPGLCVERCASLPHLPPQPWERGAGLWVLASATVALCLSA